MTIRELTVPGAWEITPRLHADARGAFFEWFTDSEFTALAGHRFDLRQANCSVSAAGMLRGVHFAQLPPSQAKYVGCPRGKVLDVIVDIRVGSPTFGRWDSVVLDDRDHRSVYISEGLGTRFFCAGRRFDGDVPVLGALQSRTRTHDQRTRSRTGHRLALGRRRTDHVGPGPRGADAAQAEAAGLLPTWERRRRSSPGGATEVSLR